MSRNRKIGKSFFQIIIALIIFFLLFFVDLDYLEDKCTFLRIFKLNVNWLEQLIESYTSLFILTVVVAFIIWAMFTLSISVKGVSFAGFEITLKDTDKAVKNNIKNYLKLDIENPIIRINTAFKGCSSLEKISVLPRIYHN